MFSTHVDIDYSQTTILEILIGYLKQLYPEPDIFQQDLIRSLQTGHCHGFTVVVLYSLYLKTQPKRIDDQGKEIPRDDYDWFNSVILLLNQWDGKLDSLMIQDRNNIDRLLVLIISFQDSEKHRDLPQNKLEQSLDDSQNRLLKREYSLAGCFTAQDFDRRLSFIDSHHNPLQHNQNTSLLEVLAPPNRITLISSYNHDIGLFHHDGFYYFYNSNQKAGVVAYSQTEMWQLSEILFQASEYSSHIPSPFGFCVFSFSSDFILYPDRSDILRKLNILPCSPDGYAENNNALHMAGLIDCEESFRFFLSPQYMDIKNKKGRTPLVNVIVNRNIALFNLLIQHKARINDKDMEGWTPLHWVATAGHLPMAEQLINRGVDIHSKSNKNVTPFHMAAQKGHYALIEKFIPFTVNIDEKTNIGYTALHFASSNGHLTVVDKLLYFGANIHEKTDVGWTALHFASSNGHLAIVEKLLQCGAMVNEKTDAGWTALHFASSNGYLATVEKLLEYQAETSIKTNEDGATPLHVAIRHTHAIIAIKLIRHHADINSKDNAGFTPLHLACQHGCFSIVEELIHLDAHVNLKTNHGVMPLHLASSSGYFEIVEELINHHASIDSETNLGWTALHFAINNKDSRTIDILLRHNASVDTQMPNGWTPLSLAVDISEIEIVKKILSKHPNLSASDDHGHTALHIAVLNEDIPIIKLLLQHGANPTLKIKNNCSAKELTNDSKILALLQQDSQHYLIQSPPKKQKLNFFVPPSNISNHTAFHSTDQARRKRKIK